MDKVFRAYNKFLFMWVGAMVAFALLSGYALWTSYQSQRQVRYTAGKLYASDTIERAVVLGRFFSKANNILSGFSSSKDLSRLLLIDDRDEREKTKAYDMAKNVCNFLVDPSGKIQKSEIKVFDKIIVSDIKGNPIVHSDSKDKEYDVVYGSKPNFEGYFSKVDITKNVNGKFLVITVPIIRKDTVVGSISGWIKREVIFTSIDIDGVSSSLGSDYIVAGDASISLLDESELDVDLYHKVSKSAGKWKDMVIYRGDDQDHNTTYAVAYPIPGFNIKVFSVVNQRVIDGPIGIRTQFLIYTFIFLVVAIGCYYLIRSLFMQQIYETKISESNKREYEVNLQKEQLQREISMRKKVEQMKEKAELSYAEIFENSPVALWEIDWSDIKKYINNIPKMEFIDLINDNLDEDRIVAHKTRFLDINKQASLISGISSKKDLESTQNKELYTEKLWVYLREILLDFVVGKVRHRSEIRTVSVDGKARDLIVNCIIVPGFEDSWERVLVSVEDITELKKIEHELRISQQEALRATEAKSRFLANMSHEFRTPMNAIKGMVQLLHNSELTADQSENLRLINSSVDSLLVIVNDILDYSKMDSVEMELHPEVTNLPQFLKELRDVIDCGALNKKLTVKSLCEQIPACVVVDNLRLRQILLNLLGNAIKFTSEGEVRLVVKEVSRDDFSRFVNVYFEVSDTGIGLPEDDIESLFKSFVQADPSITRKYGGTGLGLAICYRLVALLGGVLEAKNNSSNGATFYFTIPLELCSDLFESNSPAIDYDEVDYSDVSVLVAEDSKMNKILLKKIFEQSNIRHLKIVDNGSDAVKEFKTGNYDIIFMDIQMPILDGFEAAERIRAMDKNIRIVALTANNEDTYFKRCLQSGMNSRIVKPFNVEELLKELRFVTKFSNEQ